MLLEHRPEKAVAQRQVRNVTAHTSGNKINTTVIACGSTAGQPLNVTNDIASRKKA